MSGERDSTREHWRTILADLRRGYFDALVDGAGAEAERVIREAIEAGVPEPVISGEIVAPAMRGVGELWADGMLSVADEHLATEISLRVLALQREAFRASRARSMHPIMLTTVEGERHGLGLQMAASVLLHAGYDVRMLGTDLPMAELATAVAHHRPSVVGFSAVTSSLNGLLSEAVDEVRRAAPHTPVILGGAAAPEAAGAWPGVRLCRHVADAVEVTDALVHRAALN